MTCSGVCVAIHMPRLARVRPRIQRRRTCLSGSASASDSASAWPIVWSLMTQIMTHEGRIAVYLAAAQPPGASHPPELPSGPSAQVPGVEKRVIIYPCRSPSLKSTAPSRRPWPAC